MAGLAAEAAAAPTSYRVLSRRGRMRQPAGRPARETGIAPTAELQRKPHWASRLTGLEVRPSVPEPEVYLRALDAAGLAAEAWETTYLYVVDGEDGVRDVLNLLRDELDVAMALAGCRSIDEISLDLLRPE